MSKFHQKKSGSKRKKAKAVCVYRKVGGGKVVAGIHIHQSYSKTYGGEGGR